MRRARTVALLAVTMLMALAGCAKPDWIDRTLVTVDVTGIWQGRAGFQVDLDIRQDGPKVVGFVRARNLTPSGTIESGPIEGTVAGDVFTFRQTNGSIQGELSVHGDEMNGIVSASGIGAATSAAKGPMILRRTAPFRSDSPKE